MFVLLQGLELIFYSIVFSEVSSVPSVGQFPVSTQKTETTVQDSAEATTSPDSLEFTTQTSGIGKQSTMAIDSAEKASLTTESTTPDNSQENDQNLTRFSTEPEVTSIQDGVVTTQSSMNSQEEANPLEATKLGEQRFIDRVGTKPAIDQSQEVTLDPVSSQEMTADPNEATLEPLGSQEVTMDPLSSQEATMDPLESQETTFDPLNSQEVTNDPLGSPEVTAIPDSLEITTVLPDSGEATTSVVDSSESTVSPFDSSEVTASPDSQEQTTRTSFSLPTNPFFPSVIDSILKPEEPPAYVSLTSCKRKKKFICAAPPMTHFWLGKSPPPNYWSIFYISIYSKITINHLY